MQCTECALLQVITAVIGDWNDFTSLSYVNLGCCTILKFAVYNVKYYFLKKTCGRFGWILNPYVVGKTDLSGHEKEELAKM